MIKTTINRKTYSQYSSQAMNVIVQSSLPNNWIAIGSGQVLTKNIVYIPKQLLAFGIFLLTFCAGCKKFVTVDPPVTTLSSTSVYQNISLATSAQLNVYANVLNNQTNIGPYLTVISDELTNFSRYNALTDYYKNSSLI